MTACITPPMDPSTYQVTFNVTFARYSCRAGYKYVMGDLERSCDANGTWSGQTLLCTVDSILPKTYLVILIVGATIAAFLACIPYDFYRFRKRKKKVRDHQERLSLVTRIAPGHAKVIIDGTSDAGKSSPQPPRRFGLKSLFTIFRFVGGKLKTSGDSVESPSHTEEPGSGGKMPSNGNEAGQSGGSSSVGGFSDNGKNADVEPDGATASTLIFSPHHSSSCPGADATDDMDLLCSVSDCKDDDVLEAKVSNSNSNSPRNYKEGILKNAVSPFEGRAGSLASQQREGKMAPKSFDDGLSRSTTLENNNRLSQSTSGILDNPSSPDQASSERQGDTDLLIFQRASELFSQRLESSRRAGDADSKMARADDVPTSSEPATVEVTSMNEMTSSVLEQNLPNTNTPSKVDLPTPTMVSPTSTSSLDVRSPAKANEAKVETFRTFHHQTEGCCNPAYHSMPAISDSP